MGQQMLTHNFDTISCLGEDDKLLPIYTLGRHAGNNNRVCFWSPTVTDVNPKSPSACSSALVSTHSNEKHCIFSSWMIHHVFNSRLLTLSVFCLMLCRKGTVGISVLFHQKKAAYCTDGSRETKPNDIEAVNHEMKTMSGQVLQVLYIHN